MASISTSSTSPNEVSQSSNNHVASERRLTSRVPTNAAIGGAESVGIELLARGMAHEIRNPLSAILTAVNLINSDPNLSEETAMLLGVVKKEALRMNHILTEFSAYVKPPQPQPQTFDIAQMTRETIQILRRDGVLSADAKIEDKLPPQLLVRADPHQIAQALRRILQNSAEAIEADFDESAPHILRLAGGTDGKTTELCIGDSGPGFSSESLQRAFEPFYSKKPQAAGLGLSIACTAIHAAGGRLWIENLPVAADAPLCEREVSGLSGALIHLELPAA